jgi:DNA-binding transcriptional LysR family regulator
MDTDRLRYFCTVAQTANIHRAAELLRLSPAALSKSIKLLEGELNLKLIVPSGRGIAITDEGKLLAERATKLLDDFEGLRRAAHLPAESERPLRIGSFEVFTTHGLGPLFRDLLEERELILHELVPGRLEESLVDRHIDLGVTYLPIPHPELDFIKVATLSMGVFGKKELVAHAKVTELPFVVPVTPLHGSPTKVVGLDGWPDNMIRRKIRYRVTLMESALELCREGRAVAFLPQFVVQLHNRKVKDSYQLATLPTVDLPSRYVQQAVYVVKRKASQENQALRKLAKALRMMCA